MRELSWGLAGWQKKPEGLWGSLSKPIPHPACGFILPQTGSLLGWWGLGKHGPASRSGVAVKLDCKPGPKKQQFIFLQFWSPQAEIQV